MKNGKTKVWKGKDLDHHTTTDQDENNSCDGSALNTREQKKDFNHRTTRKQDEKDSCDGPD